MVAVYERVARAYIAGLERAHEAGRDLSTIASVASFFVSRVDTAADRELPEGSSLRGRTGVANARVAYRRFGEIFAGERWERLAAAGARVQRPLWASTGTKNPAYSDVLYVDNLVAPNTVNTLPKATLLLFAEHGDASAALSDADLDGAARTLEELAAAGVDLQAITDRLLEEGLQSFGDDFQSLLGCIDEALSTIQSGRARRGGDLGPIEGAVDDAVAALASDDVPNRLWSHDHTLWADEPTEISDRLGWLTVVDGMDEQVGDLEALAAEVAADGIDAVVLLGMGGSSLAPEVLSTTFGSAAGRPSLIVLDTTDPAEIGTLAGRLDLTRTLFIVASKSGTTAETLSHLAFFWERIPDGRHFVCITDPGTPLEATARERGFRRVFLNPPEIGGRYSALSYFGLVPAALNRRRSQAAARRGGRDGAGLPLLRARRRQSGRLAGRRPRCGGERGSRQAHARSPRGDRGPRWVGGATDRGVDRQARPRHRARRGRTPRRARGLRRRPPLRGDR